MDNGQDMTREIAYNIARTKYKDIPPEVVELTKKFIMDTIGVGIAGLNAPGCREMHRLFTHIGGREEATVIGWGNRLPSPSAAFLNSMFSHALDFDDTLDDSAMHTYVSVLPAALALAEARGDVNGKELIVAVVLGVDLCARLGLAISTPLSWIRTATCGSFGAAAAAAKILRLNRNKIHNTLGIVYSQTAGNAQCLIDGGLTKRMQPAFSARAGVLSALMADYGITGAKEVFEGRYGFFNLYEGGEYDRKVCLEDMGKKFYGKLLSIKPYPSCRMTHASIDAALIAKEKGNFGVEEIERIEVYTCEMAKNMVGGPFRIRENPQVDAQFSIPYVVAVALRKGKPFIDDFYESNIRKKDLQELADKVLVLVDNDLAPKEIKSATIKIYLKNGNIVSHKVRVFKGHPDNPLSWDECIGKFRKCIEYAGCGFLPSQIDELTDLLLNLENLESISQMTQLVTCRS